RQSAERVCVGAGGEETREDDPKGKGEREEREAEPAREHDGNARGEPVREGNGGVPLERERVPRGDPLDVGFLGEAHVARRGGVVGLSSQGGRRPTGRG